MKNQRGFGTVEGLLILFIIGIVGITGWYLWDSDKKASNTVTISDSNQSQATAYSPMIVPANFVSKIDNKYFTLVPGTKYTYENKTSAGTEKIDVVVKTQTKTIMGVTNIEVQDTNYLNDVLVEDTTDWYAQDKVGNVWYFGETVLNYENGKLKDNKGSWFAGVDGAKPGIAMEANPKVGDSYRQEYFKGKAEDMGDIVALNQKVVVPYGTYTGCLETRDWSRIDAKLNEYKYYCPGVGFMTLETEKVDGTTQRVELIKVSK